MSPRAVEVGAAFAWGVPLHVWDGTGPYPDENQKAEMEAYVKGKMDREAWERHVEARALDGKGDGTIRIG